MSAVQIDVWSDYVCPFCYLAEPELARVEREHAATVRVIWRAFELRPEPVPTLDPQGDYLRDTWARAVLPMAKQRRMNLKLPPVQPRSRLAHEATVHARLQQRGSQMRHGIFRAFFERGEDIGRIAVLAAIGQAAGLDPQDLIEALNTARHRQQVVEDEDIAAQLGASGVPALVVRPAGESFDEAVLLEGAQPYAVIAQVVGRLERALATPLETRKFEP
jgi:predicted DsbA family dithiol-disulfide isomerase